MTTYLIRRVLGSLLVVAGLLVLTFVATRYVGDPVDLLVDGELAVDAGADRAAIRAAAGLDRPVLVQFADFAADAIRGDFGRSLWQNRPAGEIVAERIPASLLLTGTVVAFSFLVAMLLAVVGARNAGRWPAAVITTGATALASVTPFWLALALILVFAVNLDWLPTSGYGSPRQIVLPALALSAQPIGMLTQVLQTSLRDELRQQYVVTARSKGLRERLIVQRHVLRNTAIVAVTLVSGLLAGLVNGAVLAEAIFAWPGLGQISLQAVQQRDLPLLMATVFVVGVLVTVVNLAADLAYVALDPRLRLR